MRIFAGPNGSGKSTIIKEIQKIVSTGPYINADEVEKTCKDKGFINLGDFNIASTDEAFTHFLSNSGLLEKARKEGFEIDISFSNNVIRTSHQVNSYTAALIADFLRTAFLESSITFSFETVMSHPSKLDVLKLAHSKGFRNYLYFISTESADINVGRVAERVKKGGHHVDEQKIRERYIRSMELLSSMIPYCHRCFILDNSGKDYELILEIIDGTTINVLNSEIPLWVDTYVLQKLAI